jgi:Ca2+/H+ antiporter, TMEM165/GDT1 family
MRHGRLVVYCGAMGALAIMHILSVLMGFALPSLLPKRYTHAASIILFLYFGYRLLKDASEMEGGKPSDELLEVEEELINKKSEGGEEDEEDDVEGGNGGKSPTQRPSKTTGNLTVFTQAFTLTFLAEWGDRSQIATIALAASKNPYGVVLGGLVGHAFCTGVAVVGGRLLAARISEKAVATIGGILFFMFAIHSFLFGPENS